MLLMEDRPTINLSDASLAATLELVYLRPLLESLPQAYRTALDVGAHKGDVTEHLYKAGFRVVAIEPQQNLADRLQSRLSMAFAEGRVTLERCAASDHSGSAELLVGRASTVSTLEPQWTNVAFPEEFQSPRSVSVPLRRLVDIRADHDLGQVGFAKVDVEGHELSALRGLLDGTGEAPLVIMFEANQRFAGAAADCIALLKAHGYERFDILVREGIAPIAAATFSGPELPAAWTQCDTPNRYFYANIIAYHESLPTEVVQPDLAAFMEEYRVAAARDVLRQALALEAENSIPVQPEWDTARQQLRSFLQQAEDWSAFLTDPTCRHMFVRGRWGAAQDVERNALESSDFGRHILATSADPAVGSPRLSEPLPALSTNTLGMAWYLDRIHQAAGHRLPQRVVEIGGGYGALARLYAQQSPQAAYAIVDLPEMLALQHYFLNAALPGTPIVFAAAGPIELQPGRITLVPISRLADLAPQAELMISTFAYSEMPRELQAAVRAKDWLGARQLFMTGQLQGEAPGASWVSAGDVVGSIMEDFRHVRTDRFHIGRNYSLFAER